MSGKLTFYAYDKKNEKYWRFEATQRWWVEHDNGCAVSIGFEVGKEISMDQLRSLGAVEVTKDEWNHSGCQSSCVKRGAKECRW